MKSCKKILFCVGLCIPFICCSALAQEEAAEISGLHGDILIGGAWFSSDNQLAPWDDNKRTSSLSGKAKTESGFVPLFSGNISYSASFGTRFFISSEEGLAAGLTHGFEDICDLTLAGGYDPGQVWKDPYVTGVNREKTDAIGKIGMIELGGILGTGLNMGYTVVDTDVDKDLAGMKNSLLKRDGLTHKLTTGYDIPLGDKNFFTPGLQYEKANMEGESNSFDSLGCSLTHTFVNEDIVISTTLAASKAEYDHVHPLFSKTRDAVLSAASSTITWLNPFGYEDFYVSAMGSYSETDSNIDFFDSKDIMFGTGLGFRF